MNQTAVKRLYSLDALRGFDMFWIMGADEIFRKIAEVNKTPFWQTIADQLEHPAWNGFHFYDLIFPLFLFLAGVATPYSVGRDLERGTDKQKLLYRAIRRGLILFVLGLIYNNHLQIKPLAEIRFGSVLGRIGIAYMFANIIYLYTKQRGQIIWFGSLLIGYWLLLKFASAPGYPPGDLTMEGNFASYIDRCIMPGKLYLGIHDPEGLCSTVPAIGTALLGIFAGNLLRNSPMPQQKKVARLLIGGVAAILLSLLWNFDFPINKNLWTSSFVLLTGGISLLLLGIFYYVIDVLGYTRWSYFFRIIGMNSILIYMSGQFINWGYTTNAFFKWLIQLVGDPYNVVALAILVVVVKWFFLYFMYRKNVFLRV